MSSSGIQRSSVRPAETSKSEGLKPESEEISGYEMILGRAMDDEKARDQWIEAVERILEDESFERGQQHLRKNFDHPSVHDDEYSDTP